MTRPEMTGKRSLEFSGWILRRLADSSMGFCVGNLDWIFWNYKTRRLLIAEEKTHSAVCKPWFSRLMRDVIDPALRAHAEAGNYTYLGFHIITFELAAPGDEGEMFWDGAPITEEELVKNLTL